MSLASPYQEHYYVADGVTVRFAFGQYFTAISQNYVKCIIYFQDGTNCVPTFDVNMDEGFITIVTLTKPDGTVLNAPPENSVVRVFRDVPEAQNITASQLQNYTAKQLEKIFDSIVAMQQETSYSDAHKTIRLTEPQRDVSVQKLSEDNDQGLLYWDDETKQIKVTELGQDDIISEIEEAQSTANEAKEIAEEAKDIAQDASDLVDTFDARITKNEEDIADIIAGGNIDGVTIQTNENGKWEAQGVKNKNTEISATSVVYDWVGTQAEYINQNVAAQHPEWLCYITDDMYDPGSTYTFEQGEAASTWYITHNLNKYPSVTVVDSAGTTIDCTVIYINSNECELRFNAAFKGSAYLN